MLDYQRTVVGVERLDVKKAMSNFAICAMATVAGCQSSRSATARLGLDMLLAVSVPEVCCYGRVGVYADGCGFWQSA